MNTVGEYTTEHVWMDWGQEGTTDTTDKIRGYRLRSYINTEIDKILDGVALFVTDAPGWTSATRQNLTNSEKSP